MSELEAKLAKLKAHLESMTPDEIIADIRRYQEEHPDDVELWRTLWGMFEQEADDG